MHISTLNLIFGGRNGASVWERQYVTALQIIPPYWENYGAPDRLHSVSDLFDCVCLSLVLAPVPPLRSSEIPRSADDDHSLVCVGDEDGKKMPSKRSCVCVDEVFSRRQSTWRAVLPVSLCRLFLEATD